MTRVIERICANDRTDAMQICKDAQAGLLDIRSVFSSLDSQARPKPQKPSFGQSLFKCFKMTSATEKQEPLNIMIANKPSLSFFELAILWGQRNEFQFKTIRASLLNL